MMTLLFHSTRTDLFTASMRLGFLCVAISLFNVYAFAADSIANDDSVEVFTTADQTVVQIAQPFTVTLHVMAPKGTRVVLPEVPNKFGEFDILDHQDIRDIPSEQTPDQRLWTRRFTLESIMSGDLEIPELNVQIAKTGDFENYKSKPITVRVTSVLEDRADPTQFRDIHSVVDVAIPKHRSGKYFWWLVGGLGLTLAVLAFVFIGRRRAWLSPEQWAIREIDALEQSASIHSDENDNFWKSLSTTMRGFLELQFGIPAPVQTTDEVVRSLSICENFNAKLIGGLGGLLAQADRARFAGWQNSPEDLSQALTQARALVMQSANQPSQKGPDPSSPAKRLPPFEKGDFNHPNTNSENN